MGQFVNTVKQETVFLLNPLNGCLSLRNFCLDRLLTSSLVLRLMLGRARRPAKRRQGHTLPLNGLLPPCSSSLDASIARVMSRRRFRRVVRSNA